MKRAGSRIAQLYQRTKRKLNNRGSAIVIVIIAMAMIGILATTLLWMAYMNYMIKVADIRNKNSFYTAEEVVEQIMSGLRRESAEAVGVAYRDVLANWDNLNSEEERKNVFMTTYMDTLIDKLKEDPPQGTAYYKRSILEAYVDASNFPRGVVGATRGVNVEDWDWGGDHSDPTVSKAEPLMEVVNNNSIILKNIYVSCTDDEDRVSIVKTDICLDVPELIFENNGSIDTLYQYSLIGNEGIEVQAPVIKMEGSIYAGTDANGKGGLQIGKETVAATKLTMEDALRVISKGDIRIDPSSSLSVRDVPGQDNRVYAKNITLNSAAASFDSKVYVANDLMLDGVGSKITLTKEYYGYSSSTFNGLPGESAANSAESSAIIINGKDSTVDMSAVTRLLIAGRSYIGQDATSAEAAYNKAQIEAGLAPLTPRTPVMMGESIAIKGGQVAYLVPAECIGTLEGESVIGQNPINADKENDIIDFKTNYGSDFCEVDFDRKVYRLGGKALREFGVADMNHIRKVYAPYRGGSLLYYYLVMDKDNAERYFVQYYDFHANREEIDTYFNRYLSGGFQLGDFADPKTEYTILGNSLISSALTDSGVTLLTGIDQTTLNLTGTPGAGGTPGTGADPNATVDPNAYTETGENAEEVTNNRTEASVETLTKDIKDDYKSLTYDLTEGGSIPSFADPDNVSGTDPYDPVKASEYVFKSIIKCKTGGSTDNVEDYLADLHVNEVTYTTTSGLQAHLSKNDVTLTGISGVDPSKLRLLVCLGDVTVDHDFTGLIIAKGKITVTGGANIKLGMTELANVLQADSEFWVADGSGDNKKPIDMFVNGGGSLLNGAQKPDIDDAGNLVLDYSELVRYMNWIKK